ncbi:hypothetical protein AB0B66_24650 [Catellatospora sp. NPDC049111]|uniref:hypothetical protein n=1 Tax=Catellatospora sp. NPDC049111 TaxID=3155271 RepID=UPI0034080F6C
MRGRTRAAAAAVALAAATGLAQTGAPAEAAVPGLQIVTTASAGGSGSPKSVTATCPAGKRVVGAGFYLDGAAAQVVLDDLIPAAGAVTATGYEDQDGTAESWWIRAYAVCADPVPGLEIVTAVSAPGSAARSTTAACPTGKRALGGGATVTGGLGQVVIDAMMPATTTVTAAAYEDSDGTTATWTLTAYAICAPALPGLALPTVTSPPTTGFQQGASPACPAGTAALGTGWDVNSRFPGSIFPVAAAPSATGVLTVALMNNAPGLAEWTLTGRAVCATP